MSNRFLVLIMVNWLRLLWKRILKLSQISLEKRAVINQQCFPEMEVRGMWFMCHILIVTTLPIEERITGKILKSEDIYTL